MNSKVRPLHDKLLVERVKAETKTAGGLIIPDTAQEKPMQGVVVAVGSGTRDEKGNIHALDVKSGDRILFAKWGGTEIKINDKELLILKEADVLAIIE